MADSDDAAHLGRMIRWCEDAAATHDRLALAVNNEKIFTPSSLASVYRHVAELLRHPEAVERIDVALKA